MRLRTALRANEAQSAAVARRRDERSHTRSGGTSTRSRAPAPPDPSVGAIGVGHAAGCDQRAAHGTTTTNLQLVGDSHDRCARAKRHELAVRQGDEDRTASARIGRHHQLPCGRGLWVRPAAAQRRPSRARIGARFGNHIGWVGLSRSSAGGLVIGWAVVPVGPYTQAVSVEPGYTVSA